MANCVFCGAELGGNDVLVRRCNVNSGAGTLIENVCICPECFKEFIDSGYAICDFCGKSALCMGKEDRFLKVWKHSTSGKSFEVQNICKEVAETVLAKKCPCCNGEILCSKEVLEELGECPRCYSNDMLFKEYIEDLDVLEDF